LQKAAARMVEIGSGDRTFQDVDERINFRVPASSTLEVSSLASWRAGLCCSLFVELDQDLGISIDALIELIVGIRSLIDMDSLFKIIGDGK
jgi:hypothetical protein